MHQNRKTPPVCDDVLIAIRRIIQSVDLHSKHLVKQFGLTGPQLIVLREISQSGEITGQRAVPGRQPEPGHGNRYIGSTGKEGICFPQNEAIGTGGGCLVKITEAGEHTSGRAHRR